MRPVTSSVCPDTVPWQQAGCPDITSMSARLLALSMRGHADRVDGPPGSSASTRTLALSSGRASSRRPPRTTAGRSSRSRDWDAPRRTGARSCRRCGAGRDSSPAVNDKQLGVRGQRLERRAGVLKMVSSVTYRSRRTPALASGIEHHTAGTLHLIGRTGGEHLARPVDEAPVALLGGLRRQVHALLFGGQRLHISSSLSSVPAHRRQPRGRPLSPPCS